MPNYETALDKLYALERASQMARHEVQNVRSGIRSLITLQDHFRVIDILVQEAKEAAGVQ